MPSANEVHDVMAVAVASNDVSIAEQHPQQHW